MSTVQIQPGSRFYLPRWEVNCNELTLTHSTGQPILFRLHEISCFEKCTLRGSLRIFTIVHLINQRSYVVMETPDEVKDEMVQQCYFPPLNTGGEK